MQSVAQNSRIDLDLELRGQDGEYIDGDTVTYGVHRPDGSTYVSASAAARRGEGLYRASVALEAGAALGIWFITWHADVEELDLGYEEGFAVFAVGDLPAERDREDFWLLGEQVHIDLELRASDGLLTDATSLALVIYNPVGDVVLTGLTPTRIARGFYRYVFDSSTVSDLGIWKVRWSGVLAGVNVSTEDVFELGMATAETVHPFGASLAVVRALLPHLVIDENSQPTETQVHGFIEGIATEVAVRIGVFSSVIRDASIVGQINTAAKFVIELGAAATTQDASYPAMSAPNETSYGGVLWERYKEALDALVAQIAKAISDQDKADNLDDPISSGIVAAPPPSFRLRMMT